MTPKTHKNIATSVRTSFSGRFWDVHFWGQKRKFAKLGVNSCSNRQHAHSEVALFEVYKSSCFAQLVPNGPRKALKLPGNTRKIFFDRNHHVPKNGHFYPIFDHFWPTLVWKSVETSAFKSWFLRHQAHNVSSHPKTILSSSKKIFQTGFLSKTPQNWL